MVAPQPVLVRCLRCGTGVVGSAYPGPRPTWVPCPHCGAPVALVPPRDPPPLYTWEVHPNLYPSAPIPRHDARQWRPAIAPVLWVAAILLTGAAASFAVISAESAGAAPVAVAGTVYRVSASDPARPLPGATVQLTADAGAVRSTLTDALGHFRFVSVPPGGVGLNVTYPGLDGALLNLFDSPYYASTDLARLAIELSPPNESTSSRFADPSFSNMESFLTSVGSGAALFAVGAVVTAWGARGADRRRLPVGVTAAGVGAAAAPSALYVLGLYPAIWLLAIPVIAASLLGAVGAGLSGAYRWFQGPFEGDRDPTLSDPK